MQRLPPIAACIFTLAACAALPACSGGAPFACTGDASCTQAGQAGRCLPGGAGLSYCAFSDPSCPSLLRWHRSAAAALAESCVAATCSDKLLDGDETDVDCGGSCPKPCGNTGMCRSGADCASGVCTNLRCRAATCGDQVRNGNESDVDCGGPCAPCPNGHHCAVATDCTGLVCKAGLCVDHCADGAKSGDETDVDCGGPHCSPCGAGRACATASDCDGGPCVQFVCLPAICFDGRRDGDETDIDCGGPTCASVHPCEVGQGCGAGTDCISSVCAAGTCQGPTCTDGVKNGCEVDIDCGMPCALCGLGKICYSNFDCASGTCSANDPPLPCLGPGMMGPPMPAGVCVTSSCTDMQRDGMETGIDCGGGTCPPCPIGMGCRSDADCQSGSGCRSGSCFPLCPDGMKDGMETDVDCGGPSPMCLRCPDGDACLMGTDCASGVCTAGRCFGPCSDGVKDGMESDVDCGGPTCPRCAFGKACTAGTDCQSGACIMSVCEGMLFEASGTTLSSPPGDPQAMVAGDFNGDGATDIAIALGRQDSCAVVPNPATMLVQPTIVSLPPGCDAVGITAADFNGDQVLDLAIVCFGSGIVAVVIGSGNFQFGPPLPFPVGAMPGDIVAVDLDGNGTVDIATANTGSNDVGVLLGDGHGGFLPVTRYGAQGQPLAIAAGDLDGDGKRDLVVAHQAPFALLALMQVPGGAFTAGWSAPFGGGPIMGADVKLADFNGDTHLDIAVASGSLEWFAGSGNGTFTQENQFMAAPDLDRLLLGDLDGDGRLDLVATNGVGQVFPFLQIGLGGFQPLASQVTTPVLACAALADLNGDHKLDLVVDDGLTLQVFHNQF